MNKVIFLLLLVTWAFVPRAYAHKFCISEAPGAYLEDLIQNLKRPEISEERKQLIERLSNALPVWQRANEKISEKAGFKNRILLCDLPGLNAYVTSKNEPVRVHLETVFLLGTNEDVIAAILGHEYSHLVYDHTPQRIAASRAFEAWANRAYRNVFDATLDPSMARNVEINYFEGQMSAFKINQELAADDFGVSLLGKAGYKPTAFHSLAIIALALYGDKKTTLFPSHPGLIERMKKGENRVTDEVYDQSANRLLDDNNLDALSALIDDWISLLPRSGNANYFRALLLRAQKKPKSLAGC